MKTFLAAAWLVLAATTASAQERGYVLGVGGFTFQSEVSGLFGGEFGVYVHPAVAVYGQIGRMINILPKSIQDDLDDAAQELTFLTGDRWEFDGKLPATYFGGGVRFIVPTQSAVRPYILGGIGVANLKASIKEIDFGEVLDDLIDAGYVDEDDVRGTRFAFEFGGGVAIPVGSRVQLDAGYRFMRVSDVNVSRFVGGFGARF